MSRTLPEFVAALRRCGLIPAEGVEQIVASAEIPNAEPKALAKWIVKKGWLSTFQVRMIWNGRENELFLGQYALIEKLGEGGMGEVFRAQHRRMGRDVALKIIRRERLDNPEAVRRFQREIQAAAQLAHENVVMAYDADQQGDTHFFAMELVEGINLARMVREGGPLAVADACNYLRQASLGLQHAYERGMVHRDIKPSNLFLSKTGVIKVLDLGLARLYDVGGESETRITQEGLVIGTPDFISPEQARDSRKADIRADIYSLGCTLYYLLTSESPYPTGTPTEKMLKHTSNPIPDITEKRSDIPSSVKWILEKMLAKDPQHRFQTPAEVANALANFLNDPASGVLVRGPVMVTPAVPMAEPSTESHFRIKANDGKVELNPLYEPRESGINWLVIILGIGSLIGIAVLLLALR